MSVASTEGRELRKEDDVKNTESNESLIASIVGKLDELSDEQFWLLVSQQEDTGIAAMYSHCAEPISVSFVSGPVISSIDAVSLSLNSYAVYSTQFTYSVDATTSSFDIVTGQNDQCPRAA